MREIKFRGKSLKTGEWVYGSLISCEKYTDIWTPNEDGVVSRTEVHPETVGQFTGLRDKNGKEIYEGDIVEHYEAFEGKMENAYVIWHANTCSFCYEPEEDDGQITMTTAETDMFEVIGNIHDNPELINKTV